MSTFERNPDDVDGGWGEGSEERPDEGAPPPKEEASKAASDGRSTGAADDGRAEKALAFVRDLVAKMGMEVEATLGEAEEESEDGAGEIRIDIEGHDAGRIIGKKGQVLAAMQYIVNRVVNRPGLDRRYVIVDAEGYHRRREETLATMAQRLGKKAVAEGKIITFEPMSPRDRRVVHLALAKFPGVVTKSDGEGEGRRVQIIPVRR